MKFIFASYPKSLNNIFFGLFLTGVLLFVLLSNYNPSYISYFDEVSHFDVVYKLYNNGSVPLNTKLDDEVVRYWGCSDIKSFKDVGCKDDFKSVSAAPLSGQNSASKNSLFSYYIIAVVTLIASVITAIDGNSVHELLALAKFSQIILACMLYIVSMLVIAEVKYFKISALILLLFYFQYNIFLYYASVVNIDLVASLIMMIYLLLISKSKSSIGNEVALVIFGVLCLLAKLSNFVILIVCFLKLLSDKKIAQAFKISLTTVFLYFIFVLCERELRGLLPDNRQMEMLLKSLPEQNISFNSIYQNWCNSYGSPNWRVLYNPFSMFLDHYYIILYLSIVLIILVFFANFLSAFQVRFGFIVSVSFILSVILLPILMYSTQMIQGLPFFFQPRYHIVNYFGFVVGFIMLVNDLFCFSKNTSVANS